MEIFFDSLGIELLYTVDGNTFDGLGIESLYAIDGNIFYGCGPLGD